MLRSVKTTQRKMRQLELIKTGAGTPALSGPASGQASIADNGVGDYTITFDETFANTPVCIPVCVTSDCIIDTMTVANGSVQITCVDSTDGTTAKEGDFHLLVFGSDVTDKY